MPLFYTPLKPDDTLSSWAEVTDPGRLWGSITSKNHEPSKRRYMTPLYFTLGIPPLPRSAERKLHVLAPRREGGIIFFSASATVAGERRSHSTSQGRWRHEASLPPRGYQTLTETGKIVVHADGFAMPSLLTAGAEESLISSCTRLLAVYFQV